MIKITIDLPKKEFATKKWLDSIASVQRQKSVPALRKLFNQTVFGWSTKPRMGWAQSKSTSEISLSIYPTGDGADTWELLSVGARPHPIQAKSGGLLRFRPGYRSATRPGVLQSRRAYRSGKVITPKKVDHPGFSAREFPELIAQEYASEFGIDMQEAVNEAAKT